MNRFFSAIFPESLSINKLMSLKYNFLPGAIHFAPFFAGEENHLQCSYTTTHMYCKVEKDILGEKFIYVEKRQPDSLSLSHLDQLATDEYIASIAIFGCSPRDERGLRELEEIFSLYRTTKLGLKENLAIVVNTEPSSEEHLDAKAVAENIANELSEYRKDAQVLIDKFNTASGYNVSTKSITPSSP